MQGNSMRVRALRRQLSEIPGALMDVPPGDGHSGHDDGVVGNVVHTPDAMEGYSDAIGYAPEGLPDDGDAGPMDRSAFDPVFEWAAEAEDRIRQLGNQASAAIRQSVQVDGGTDALGHYLSFHVCGAQWGATVKLSGIAYLVRNCFAELPGSPLDHARLAFHAIVQHELFHFATDIALAQAELAQQQAWWAPAGAARLARGDRYSEREEMLANGWMLRAFRTALPGFQVRGKQSALKSFVRNQPPGYLDALVLRPDSWPRELHELVHDYARDADRGDSNPLLWDASYDWPCQFPIWPHIDWRNCAIHLVDDSVRYGVPAGWLTYLERLSKIEESPKFLKQLGKLSPQVAKRWHVAKTRVMDAMTCGRDLKPWPKGGANVWSMRVNDSIRAHLLRDRDHDKWTALEIGSHKAMGHG